MRLLAPFDPVVWDRRRFELLWGWAYRFEAYTPAPKRKLGYYALPLLWRDRVIGWANLSVKDGELRIESATWRDGRRRIRASRAKSRRSWPGCACFSGLRQAKWRPLGGVRLRYSSRRFTFAASGGAACRSKIPPRDKCSGPAVDAFSMGKRCL